MKNNKLKYLSTRFKVLVGAGILVLAGTTYGCAKNKKSSDDKKMASPTDATATVDEMSLETNETEKYYNEIDMASEDVINFINDSLSKGTYDFEITEDMKESIAKTYLDYYLMMNQNQLSGNAFSILNQDNDMIALDMMNSSMISEQFIQEQTITSEKETVLNYENLIKDETDRNFIQNLAGLVASMHTAVKNNDKDELDSLAKQVIEIKEGLKTNNAEYSMIYKPMTIDLAIMLIDSADGLYNGEIITDDEDLAQIYNTSFVKCVDGEYISAMTDERINELASELMIEGYQSMTREQILEAISNLHHENVSEVSIRSSERTMAKSMMAEILSNTKSGEFNEEYSYRARIQYIASKIDLSLHVRPIESNLDVLNNNPFGPNFYKEDSNTKVGTSYSYEISANEVPEQYKEGTTNDTVVYEKDDNGNTVEKKSNEVYAKAKADAITAGSAAAAKTYQSSYAGHASDMPTKSVGKVPSLSSTNYNEVYNYFYNLEWNNCRSSYISMEENAKKDNENNQPIFVPTDNGEETTYNEYIIDVKPSDNNDSISNQPSSNDNSNSNVEFIPIDDGEEIIEEEEIITISWLKELKNEILRGYATARVNDSYYTIENNNTKRM